jgi:muramidase (phage lysozyme)
VDFFKRIRRFAGDRINQAGEAIQNLIKPPKAAAITIPPSAGSYAGPGGDPSGSGLGQARQTGIDPRRQALRETISAAEGTANADGTPNYAMRYGDKPGSSGTLDINRPHPITTRPSPWGGSATGSNASGAYQFLDNTWSEMNDGKNVVMSPMNQDRAVDRLIDERTDFDRNRPLDEQISTLSDQWASFPTDAGASRYDQPVKSADTLSNIYDERLDVNLLKEQDRLKELGLR